jgi:hypothetical protein
MSSLDAACGSLSTTEAATCDAPAYSTNCRDGAAAAGPNAAGVAGNSDPDLHH